MEYRANNIILLISHINQINSFISDHKIKIIQKNNNTIIGRQGSQFITRFLGGWFVSPKHFPKKITFTIKPEKVNTSITIKLEEALGFGLLDPIFKKKYANYFELLFKQCDKLFNGIL